MQQFNQNSQEQIGGEQVIWKGGSSQLLNFKHYFIAFIVVATAITAAALSGVSWLALFAVVGLIYGLYHYMVVNAASYTLTNQRIIRKYGLMNRTTFEVELYRVKDVHLFEPLQLRMFGLGTIHLISSQKSSPVFELKAVKNAAELREELRHLVEHRRNEKGVGEYDTN